MNAFARLARTAVVGTQGSAPDVALGDAEADAIVARPADDSPERAVLRAAAVLGAVRRATLEPRELPAQRPAAPAETSSRCGPRAAADLAMLLADGRGPGEWLRLAARFGVRAPEETLPKLLRYGAAHASSQDAIVAVIGERGRWLAREADEWRYATTDGHAPAASFECSPDRTLRVRALASMRESDAAAARGALEASWAAEAPDDRAPLLAALATGLSNADEPFLESARADKRKDVRATALGLLRALPGSQAAARAIALATPLLAREPAALGGGLRVTLPQAYTPAMKAEGVERASPIGVGERSYWLTHVLAITPVAHWLATFDVSFERLIELARAHEFSDALLAGFALAIDAYGDRANRTRLAWLAAADDGYVDLALTSARGADASATDEAPFIAALRADRPRAGALLACVRAPWTTQLSAAALAYARTDVAGGQDWAAFSNRAALFARIAQAADPQTPGVAAGWPEYFANEKARDLVETLLATLHARKAMHDNLKDGS